MPELWVKEVSLFSEKRRPLVQYTKANQLVAKGLRNFESLASVSLFELTAINPIHQLAAITASSAETMALHVGFPGLIQLQYACQLFVECDPTPRVERIVDVLEKPWLTDRQIRENK